MEIKRKAITREDIFKNEQKLIRDITDICQFKRDAFGFIGYELDLEFGQKENELQARFENLSDDENKKFEPGYISRAMITVKRPKTEEEKAEALQQEQENLDLLGGSTDEEATPTDDETAVNDSDAENMQSVAFTRVMLVRCYKSFWTEWVNLGDDLAQLEADLDEFFEVLSQKADKN